MSAARRLASGRSSPRELLALLGIIALAVMPLVAYLLWTGYQEAIHKAESTTRDYAAILEARLDATLRRADAILESVVRTTPVAALSRQAVPHYAADLNAALDYRTFKFKEIAGIRVTDRHGDTLYSSTSASTPRVNVADRDYFRILRDKPQAGLVFSEVIIGRSTNRQVMAVARALTDGQGNFGGIVYVLLELEHFQKLFDSLDVGAQGAIAWRHADDHQRLVLRWPALPSEINKSLEPQHPIAQRLAAGERAASLQYVFQTDGVLRIASYKVLENYPFYVNVAVARDDALADWRTRSRAIAALGLLLLGILAWLLLRLSRAMAREVQTKDALMESERFARASLDALAAHIAVLDADGRILATNRRWREFAEQNAEAAERVDAGSDYLGISQRAGASGDEFAQSAATLIQDLISGRRMEGSFEYPCHAPHEARWFVCRGRRFPGEGPVRVVLSHENITGRRQAEEALRLLNLELDAKVQARTADLQQANVQMVRALKELTDFKAALDEHAIVATTDAHGTIIYVNDKFCAISKYAREELLGQNHRLINSGHHPQAFFGELWQTIASGGIWKGEIQNRAKDGTFYWVDTTIVPFLDEHLKPVQYIAIRADITARKNAEQALIAAKDDAEHANRAKDSFLATMSHEIRTPLGGLTGMLELLSLSKLDAEQSETLQTARDSGRSLLRILNDILDWSKIEEGKLELAPQASSMGVLLAEVANTYSHVASGNSVTLNSQVDARLSPAHLVDPLRLSQVLNNFVSNAIKFTHGGRVELRAELVERIDDAEQVRFSVQDNGIGIAPEVQQRLFQSYSQASADTARMYGGTGLGLAICRRLADLMDGQIEVQSAVGQGSTFSITLMLPIAAVVVETGQIPAGIEPAPFAPPLIAGVVAADAPLVLVVDDNPINRKLMVRQLGLLGFRSQTAENGEAALAQWRKGGFALVITDCHMPVMDGYEFTRTVREIEADKASEADRGAEADTAWPHTPILAWTANALADEIENCRAAGMDELLVKPAELVQLKALLAKWLPVAADTGCRVEPGMTKPSSAFTVAPLFTNN